jgi:hypothetical protein
MHDSFPDRSPGSSQAEAYATLLIASLSVSAGGTQKRAIHPRAADQAERSISGPGAAASGESRHGIGMIKLPFAAGVARDRKNAAAMSWRGRQFSQQTVLQRRRVSCSGRTAEQGIGHSAMHDPVEGKEEYARGGMDED